jgi:glycosyltransferase involved in cell wall biosynthesis
MVTQPVAERFEGLRRSIAAYAAQTYPDRELIVLVDAGATVRQSAIRAHVDALGRNDVRVQIAPGAMTLGALRNLSWRCANGELVCQWDDDDMHHPQRVERQVEALDAQQAQALCLQQAMHFAIADRALHCLNFHGTPWRSLAATLLCRRDAAVSYPEAGESSRRGEDTALIEQLQAAGGFCTLPDAPYLYVYLQHGVNTSPPSHHRMLVDRLAVSSGWLARREPALRRGLAAFDFGDDALDVRGYNGCAFTLDSPRSRLASA